MTNENVAKSAVANLHPIADTTRIARGDGFIDAEIGGELVGLHLASGNCYGFNPTATRIWALIDQPMRFDDLCAALMTEFDVDIDTCRRDTAALVAELVSEKLVTTAET
jgi:Coenzyme PQQ synthesis protein D (PqqD)